MTFCSLQNTSILKSPHIQQNQVYFSASVVDPVVSSPCQSLTTLTEKYGDYTSMYIIVTLYLYHSNCRLYISNAHCAAIATAVV